MCLSPAAIEEGLRIQPRRRHGEQAVTTDLRKRRTGKDKAADKQAGVNWSRGMRTEGVTWASIRGGLGRWAGYKEDGKRGSFDGTASALFLEIVCRSHC